MMKNAWLPLLSVMLLAACQDNVSKLPDSAYSCQPWPEAPKGTYGYGTIGRYIVAGNSSYMDCKSKLSAIKP